MYSGWMRVEPYEVGSYVHVLKRGARGMPIVGDEFDQQRFLRILFHMNDEFLDENWDRLRYASPFARMDSWPKRKPLVKILAYTLMPNHMHLLLKEIRDGGLSEFMRKVGQSMTNHHNEKYGESGSIFQGSYRSRTIESDVYLRYVASYIMVKNTFELYPHGGLRAAVKHFDEAWKWAVEYPFSSLGEYAGVRQQPIIEKELLDEIYAKPFRFKDFARDVIASGKWHSVEFE